MDRKTELETIIRRAQRNLDRTNNFAMRKIDESIIARAREELKELESGV
jgi:hypothetical protein